LGGARDPGVQAGHRAVGEDQRGLPLVGGRASPDLQRVGEAHEPGTAQGLHRLPAADRQHQGEPRLDLAITGLPTNRLANRVILAHPEIALSPRERLKVYTGKRASGVGASSPGGAESGNPAMKDPPNLTLPVTGPPEIGSTRPVDLEPDESLS